MSIWKRAYLHTVRKKAKTTLMFLILLIISTLILTSLSIHSATNTAALNIRKSLMGGFTINAKHLDTLLDSSVVTEILNHPGMNNYFNLRSYSIAEYQNMDGKKLETKRDGALNNSIGFEHSGKLVSSTHSKDDTYFTEAGFELIEGRHITTGDKNKIIVSDTFIKINGLKNGDHLRLNDINSKRQVELEIVGIFKPKQEMKSRLTTPMTDLYENICFTDDTTYSQLSFEKGDHYQYGDFNVDDPAELDSILTKIKSITGVKWEDCVITKNDAAYQNAKTQLESLQDLVTAVVIVLITISVVVIALILLLWIRNRIHEIGMMLAMGFARKYIIMQHITELFIIAVIAIALSFGTSSLIAQQVGDEMFKRVAEEEQVTINDLKNGTLVDKEPTNSPTLESIDIKISISELFLVYTIGGGIILLSIAVASYPIMRLKPKEILTKMS